MWGDWIKHHIRLVILVLWLGATLVAILFSTSTLKLQELYNLAINGTKVNGIITEMLPEKHQRIRYSFMVNGETHNWGGFASDLGKKFDQISVGERVPITYDPENPEVSCLGDPKPTLYSNAGLAALICLSPTFAVFVLGIKSFNKLAAMETE